TPMGPGCALEVGTVASAGEGCWDGADWESVAKKQHNSSPGQARRSARRLKQRLVGKVFIPEK
ncbi:MAG TPA: hypothetical protein VHW43_02075, partial [Puia sp.]|nr:hypothetical protein [Puia sp.]